MNSVNEKTPLIESKNLRHAVYQPFVSLLTLFVFVTIFTLIFKMNSFSPSIHEVITGLSGDDMTLVHESLKKFEHNYKVLLQGEILAEGTYMYNVEGNGWNYLHVSSIEHNKFADILNSDDTYFLSMEAMGFLEGYATCVDINHFYVNFYSGLFDGGDPKPETVQFLKENYAWMKSESDLRWQTSEYWLSVKIVLHQMNGMLAGLRRGCPGTYYCRIKECQQPKILNLFLFLSFL
jgi:hypothetical protein